MTTKEEEEEEEEEEREEEERLLKWVTICRWRVAADGTRMLPQKNLSIRFILNITHPLLLPGKPNRRLHEEGKIDFPCL